MKTDDSGSYVIETCICNNRENVVRDESNKRNAENKMLKSSASGCFYLSLTVNKVCTRRLVDKKPEDFVLADILKHVHELNKARGSITRRRESRFPDEY